MVKPELGQKRTCVSCSTRFYDLSKPTAVCPNCGTEQPAEQPRPRRGGNVTELRKPKKVAVADEAEADPEGETESEAEEEALEDTADLDDDDDDALATELEVEPDGDEAER